MKHLYLIIIFFLIPFLFLGQVSLVQEKPPGIYLQDGSKVDEYKKTYEIKDVSHPDPATLSKIDMSKYWKFMKTNDRVEVLDDVTDLTLILYTRKESEALIDFKTVLVIMPAGSVRSDAKNP